MVPQPSAPLRSASKAALHHHTRTLRASLAETPIRVVGLMPPAAATGPGGAEHGTPLDEFCDGAIAGIDAGAPVVEFGTTAGAEVTTQVAGQQELFDRMSGRVAVAGYRLAYSA